MDVHFRSLALGYGECQIPILFLSQPRLSQAGTKSIVMPVRHIRHEIAIVQYHASLCHLDLGEQVILALVRTAILFERQSGFLAWIASLRLTLHRLALAGKVLR